MLNMNKIYKLCHKLIANQSFSKSKINFNQEVHLYDVFKSLHFSNSHCRFAIPVSKDENILISSLQFWPLKCHME